MNRPWRRSARQVVQRCDDDMPSSQARWHQAPEVWPGCIALLQVGTPYFVSPEVVRGAGYDWKSDVWSLGCLLYELAALRSPFEVRT